MFEIALCRSGRHTAGKYRHGAVYVALGGWGQSTTLENATDLSWFAKEIYLC